MSSNSREDDCANGMSGSGGFPRKDVRMMEILALCTHTTRSLTPNACSLEQDAEASDEGGEARESEAADNSLHKEVNNVRGSPFSLRAWAETGFLLLLTHLLAEGRHEAIPGDGHGWHLWWSTRPRCSLEPQTSCQRVRLPVLGTSPVLGERGFSIFRQPRDVMRGRGGGILRHSRSLDFRQESVRVDPQPLVAACRGTDS
jgi:hypothetical protein